MLFSCNRFYSTPTTVQRLHILLLATVMTVHPYILQQILAYIFHSIRYLAKEKKKHPATVVVVVGAFCFGCLVGVLLAFLVVFLLLLFCFCCWCAVFVRFWAVLGVFWAWLGKLSTRCPFVRSACVFRRCVVWV